MLHLCSQTDPRWVEVALADLDRLLVDHAHCEHKAAVTALSFVSKYPDDPQLVTTLAALAQEEAGHFCQLVALIAARGLPLGHPDPDPYVQGLLAASRPGVLPHRVDRLLSCALIEARSCERLRLLADAMQARGLPFADLYQQLWREEAGHHTLFIELAERSLARAGHKDAPQQVARRLAELAAHEAAVLAACPLRAAIH